MIIIDSFSYVVVMKLNMFVFSDMLVQIFDDIGEPKKAQPLPQSSKSNCL